MLPAQQPSWQLPPGVTRGLWEYAHTDVIADDYDDYFASNRLFDLDSQVLATRLRTTDAEQPAVVADLGCGTGRALIPLARRGFRGLAVDLSERMLQIVRRKAEAEKLPIQCVRANLVELDALADHSVDYAISLFSTLGMIQGGPNRQRTLEHVRRVLKPSGLFVLHVHNFWYNLYDPGGPWWLVRNFLRAKMLGDEEVGDKFFHYRGVHNMFLHAFRRGELTRALRRSDFAVQEWIPLATPRHRRLCRPWLLGRFRANGWIAICR